MKQLVILSGKGGTGKTTVAGAFIRLSGAGAAADCDVDAPNLLFLMKNYTAAEKTEYYGMPKAAIDADSCVSCGLCRQFCRFGAVCRSGGVYAVDTYACEGCGVCAALCPAGAVGLLPAAAGELTLSRDGERVFSSAKLRTGSGNSGKLVTEVKRRMKSASPGAALAIIDGSPGIGCPVIASLSGVDMVLIVAEPTVSGMSDMERIIKTALTFRVKIAVCVNKYDLNENISRRIGIYCAEHGLHFAGRIPFDPAAAKASDRGIALCDTDGAAGRAVREIYDNTMKILEYGED